jgi:hypothetical protein
VKNQYILRFAAVTVMNIKITVFGGVILCGLIVANIPEELAAFIFWGGGQGGKYL